MLYVVICCANINFFYVNTYFQSMAWNNSKYTEGEWDKVIKISLPIIIYENIVICVIDTMSVRLRLIMVGSLSLGYRQIEPKVDVKRLLLICVVVFMCSLFLGLFQYATWSCRKIVILKVWRHWSRSLENHFSFNLKYWAINPWVYD